MRIRTDDTVIVISGKDKGKSGRVIRTDPKKDRVYVEGLNMVKRHQRPLPGRPNMPVGVIEKEGPIHVSNVAIADPRVAAARAAHHPDAQDLAGAGVVGDLEPGLVLDHFARSSTSTSRQRLLRDIGRHSWTRTVSPVPASLRSSWACSLIEVRMILW